MSEQRLEAIVTMYDRQGYPYSLNLWSDDDSAAGKWLRLMIRNGTLTLDQGQPRARIELQAFWDTPA